MVNQIGVLSRSPGATSLPSKPMMMPAMIKPMISTKTPSVAGPPPRRRLPRSREVTHPPAIDLGRATGGEKSLRLDLLWRCGQLPRPSGDAAAEVAGLPDHGRAAGCARGRERPDPPLPHLDGRPDGLFSARRRHRRLAALGSD